MRLVLLFLLAAWNALVTAENTCTWRTVDFYFCHWNAAIVYMGCQDFLESDETVKTFIVFDYRGNLVIYMKKLDSDDLPDASASLELFMKDVGYYDSNGKYKSCQRNLDLGEFTCAQTANLSYLTQTGFDLRGPNSNFHFSWIDSPLYLPNTPTPTPQRTPTTTDATISMDFDAICGPDADIDKAVIRFKLHSLLRPEHDVADNTVQVLAMGLSRLWWERSGSGNGFTVDVLSSPCACGDCPDDGDISNIFECDNEGGFYRTSLEYQFTFANSSRHVITDWDPGMDSLSNSTRAAGVTLSLASALLALLF